MNFQIYNQGHPKSFRMTPKEIGATNFMRCRMRMSINHIAELLGRSTASIHLVLRKNNMVGILDNRGKGEVQNQNRRFAYQTRANGIKMAIRLWMDGKAESIKEALTMTIKGFGRIPGQGMFQEPDMTQQHTTSERGIHGSGDDQEDPASENEHEEEPA